MTNFENIVLEGGGVRGFAYVGVIKALMKLDRLKDINHVVGTSVGSLTALIFILKVNIEQIDKYTNLIIDKVLKLDNNIIHETELLYQKFGVHDNQCIYDVVEEILYDQYSMKEMTFIDLFNKTNVELTIVGTCISERKPYYFNYITAPDMSVATAIKISTSLPIFYTCVNYDGKVWVDGGVCDNFAIEYFDYNGVMNPFTLGLTHTGDDEKPGIHEITSLKEAVLGVIDSCMSQIKNLNIRDLSKRNIITVNTGDISTIDFNITPAKRDFLEKVGYDATIEYFNQHLVINKKLEWKDYFFPYKC
jgi:NTE family protein